MLIFIGGGAGSLVRFGVSYFLPYQQGKFPVATFITNLVASFILGLLLHYVSERSLPDSLRYLLVIGFCGGFSTFSTFAAESWYMWRDSEWTLWMIYALSSVLISIIMIWAGLKCMDYLHSQV